MARKKGICKNHPERDSFRRCYHCKEYICSACQQTHEHHFFCSLSCFYKWKVEPFWIKIKSRKEFIFILIFIFVSDIFLYNVLKIESPEQKVMHSPDTHAIVDSSWMGIDTTHLALNYALTIELRSSGIDQPVLLWKNGKFISSIKARDGKISFGSHYFSNGKNSFSLWTMNEKGHSSLVDSFTVFFSSARIDYLKKQVSRTYTPEKQIALTFDGGSSNRTTLNILDTLNSRGITCTMFLTGGFIKRYPDYVTRIIIDGHEVGNHSYNHLHLTNLEIDGSAKLRPYVNRSYIHNELDKTDSLFNLISGEHLASFWRAPFGEINPDILLWAAEAGYKHINWSLKCDSWDWVADTSSNLYRSADEIYTYYMNLENELGLNGRVLLMHLGSERQSDFPYTVLGRLIDSLQERGYTFTTVSKLLSTRLTSL